MPNRLRRPVALAALAAAAGSIALAGPSAEAPNVDLATLLGPDSGRVLERVGGSPDHEVRMQVVDGQVHYVAGPARVTTPLPVGYPRPTAPGAFEVKHYPSVRRAEIRAAGSGDDGMYGRNSTGAFWPLFRHISTRNIEMTAPVEMDYGLESENGETGDWSMSFLYRTPEDGPTGRDGRIRVHDTEPVTVLAAGVRGGFDADDMPRYLERMTEWIESSGRWRVAGSPRTFGYNGPETSWRNRWQEVQIPIEPVTPGEPALPAPQEGEI